MNEFSAVTKTELETVEGGLNPQPLPPRVLSTWVVRDTWVYQAVKAIWR